MKFRPRTTDKSPRLTNVAKTRKNWFVGRSAQRRRVVEYRFVIDAFTPETIPLWRLAEYMADLAVIMGEREHVHFGGLKRGSAVLVPVVDWEAVPKVRKRVHDVKRRVAPQDVLKTADNLNRKLADDNAVAELRDFNDAKVIRFPGRDLAVEPEFAFSQPGELYGQVIVVGGTSDPVPVHLEDGERVHLCEALRPIARELAKYIFGATIRVQGVGRWAREADGTWKMRSFRITSFLELDDRPLTDVIADLRSVPAEWKQRDDPLGDLRRLRKPN